MRYLIVLLIVVVGVLLWRRSVRGHTTSREQPERASAQMVQCRVCGVYLPQDDALRHGDFFYCTSEHRDRDATV